MSLTGLKIGGRHQTKSELDVSLTKGAARFHLEAARKLLKSDAIYGELNDEMMSDFQTAAEIAAELNKNDDRSVTIDFTSEYDGGDTIAHYIRCGSSSYDFTETV